jgi:hypothetical protein
MPFDLKIKKVVGREEGMHLYLNQQSQQISANACMKWLCEIFHLKIILEGFGGCIPARKL